MTRTANDHVKVQYLAQLVRNKRKSAQLTLQELADEIGVSIATLSRLEKHADPSNGPRPPATPDTRTLSAVTQWLGIPLEQVLDIETNEQAAQSTADVDLPLLVETHLRATKRLKPEHAELIGSVFRTMYEKALLDADERANSGKGD